ncbi:MAG: hypothetical protein BGO69_08890 [Bacteroidetes bacterium 46-16]|nr:MAG: hypothetical protein BGO69_08890 [Bacteroidetes bacterium 46-16]
MLACCVSAEAQSQLDNYLTGTNTFTVIGTASDNLTSPHDLDFVPGRPDEWWVLNKEANGGSIVIFFDAGKVTQSVQFRRDSHNEHFMARSVALAMGDNGTFCSAQEIKNTASASSTFMGPALWSNDTSVFARVNQNNWVTGQPLGSHLDMLHQSPFGMGVAHDSANVYWYFDGYNGNICRYDFEMPHASGGDDHSDGRIYRYTDVSVVRKPNIPSHLTLDKQNSWLYIVDGGNNKILRLKTTSGIIGGNLAVPSTANEPLGSYKSVVNTTTEVVASTGLTSPCGIDYRSGRIIVSDNADGKIYIYDVTAMPAVLLGSINTGTAGIMGVRIDDNNKIWFVNQSTKQLIRIDNPNVLAVPTVASKKLDVIAYPNPAHDMITVKANNIGASTITVAITDIVGRQVYKTTTRNSTANIDVSNWIKGIYALTVSAQGGTVTQKIAVE